MERAEKRKINILYISSFPDLQGGGQRSLLLLIDNLDKNRFKPVVIVPQEGPLSGQLDQSGVETISMAFPRIRSINIFAFIAAVLKLKNIVRRFKIDIIHADSTREAFYAGIVRMLTAVEVILHLRVSDRVGWIDRIVYRLCTRMIAVSKSLLSSFKDIDINKKIEVVYNAVDTAVFKPSGNMRCNDGILKIGYFGRIVPRKGIDLLIKAVRKMKHSLKLIVIGSGEAAYLAQLKDMADDDPRIEFSEYKADIRGELDSVDVMVLPSVLGEGLSRIIIESLALGKVAVVSDNPENVEAIGEELNQFAFKTGDANDLARVLAMIAESPELLAAAGEKSRQRAENLFDAAKNTKYIEAIYDSILDKSKNGSD